MRLNKNPLKEIPYNNFGGGYAGAKGASSLSASEALDLDNIVVLPDGAGFKNRQANKFLSLVSGSISNTSDGILGLGTYKGASNERLIWVVLDAGQTTDVSVLDTIIGTPGATSRHTYTSSGATVNTIFTLFNFQSKVIGVGGRLAPFKVVPGTSGGALAGTPPNGTVGLSWNNRCWIGNTSANPSKLSYSILNDPEDWSSSGSGFVEPSAGDGDEITAVVPIANNVLLLFKNRSIYQVVGRTDPFAVFPLFQNEGCVGKHAAVGAEGLVYFITPAGRMKITDGNRIYDNKDIASLSNADDLWDQVPKTRLPYIQGFRQSGKSFDWIVWMVSYGSSQATNNYALIWDLKNKCWLKCSTGYNGNVAAKSSTERYYIGDPAYPQVFELDYPSYYTDDSQGTFNNTTVSGSLYRPIAPTDPRAVRWYWRTDDIALNSLENVVQVDRINVLTQYAGNGDIKLSYGYDGYHDIASVTKSIIPYTFLLGTSILGVDKLGGVQFSTETVRPLGRGNTFNCKIEGTTAIGSSVTKYTLSGRQAATKVKEVR